MTIGEYVRSAFDTFRSQPVRTTLTLVSIAIGIVAIVGAGGAASSLKHAVLQEIMSVGSYTFIISRMPSIITSDEEWRRYMRRKPITYVQAAEYKRRMQGSGAVVCLYATQPGITVRAGNLSTNPDVALVGSDEALFPLWSYQIASGRPIIAEDVEHARMVAVIGNDVRINLFPDGSDPVGKEIQVGNHRFRVVGVLAPKGGIFGRSQDNLVIVPLTTYVRTYVEEFAYSLQVLVKASSQQHLEELIDESIGLLRSIRNVAPGAENDFEIEAVASVADQIGSFLRFLGVFGAFCGAIALVAAGVGVMNIMLISVKERTREIGLRKAVGATVRSILVQFLVEAVVLCQIGAAAGIAVGWLLSVGLATLARIEVVFPLEWVAVSVLLCTAVGVSFGAYPAWKAARLSPIEALRYE